MTDNCKDTRAEVEIDLSDNELFELMLMAHNQDITLNQLIENVLREYIDALENKLG